MVDKINKIYCPEFDNFFNWDIFYSINPNKIKWAITTNSWFDVCKNEWYKVYDGNWDKRLEIEKDFVYSSIYNMFKNRVSFQETELYKTSIEQIKQGMCRWGCKTEQDFKWREGQIRSAFAYINTFGFKTQNELEKEGHITVKLNNKNIDDPGVAIDRDGRLLYHNANHRLPIFQILNIPEIKLKINVRHKEWAEFIQFVNRTCELHWGFQKCYQPIKHIEFNNYKSEWSDYRFKIIKSVIGKDCKTLLDIGSLFGYFSSSFEEYGLDCTAVESNKEFAFIMNKLRISEDKEFQVINDDIFNLKERKFDVVLALNIFHHFLKKEETYKKLVEFLKSLDMKEMYFQVHSPEEKQMINAYRNFNNQDFINFILENSCLNYSKEIGEENGRKIYKLWR